MAPSISKSHQSSNKSRSKYEAILLQHHTWVPGTPLVPIDLERYKQLA